MQNAKKLKKSNVEAPKIDELKEFTLKGYIKLLKYLDEIYEIVPFCELPREDIPYLILRHDADLSLSTSLRMAKIENDLGIKSTYFVLFSSPFYNLIEEENVTIINQISDLGHEIGLHYDPSIYQSYNRDPRKTLEIEIHYLEHLLGKTVKTISRHGPWVKDPFASINRYLNANHPRLRRDLFLHESCRAWTPLQGLFKLLNDPPRRIQFLTHPENWQEDKIERVNVIDRCIQALKKNVMDLEKDAKEVWTTDSLVHEYDNMMKKGDFGRFYDRKSQSALQTQNSYRQELTYYSELARWYFINTSFGRHSHKLVGKIRDALDKMNFGLP